MNRIANLIICSSLGLSSFGQTAVTSRSPQPGTPNQGIPPSLKEYDFGAQLRALNDVTSLDPAITSSPAVPVHAASDASPGPVAASPNQRDIPLSATAVAAVRVSEKWRGEPNQPAAGADGRVLYSFGAGLPTVVCAPLRVCIIELQAGEHIVGEPQIGDSVRWNISPAQYGAGANTTSVIVLKPTMPGLDTNLLIATDRRAYYLRLISKSEEYVARVAFQYPADDSARKWQEQVVKQEIAAKQARRDADTPPAVLAVEKLNFEYDVKTKADHLRPVRVYDDGSKTYIQMPSEMQNREAPVLLVLGSDGKGEMTNYRVRQQTYIVDRLFDRAELVLGTGKKAEKVEISREPKG